MRTAALVLGCVGGVFLLCFGILVTVQGPAGLLYVGAGVLGIAGGIAAQYHRGRSTVMLSIAAACALGPAAEAGKSPHTSVALLLGGFGAIFALAAVFACIRLDTGYPRG